MRLCQAEEFLSDITTSLQARAGDHLVPAHVKGDAYCLFRCLSWGCLGDESTEMVRKLYAYALSVFMKLYAYALSLFLCGVLPIVCVPCPQARNAAPGRESHALRSCSFASTLARGVSSMGP
jgi:hypothetical protein